MALTPEVDIRFYSAAGTRLTLPTDWITGIDFQIGEQGGYLDGTLHVQAPYGGAFQTFELERIDVRLWGQFLYRGYIRISQSDTSGDNETQSPTMYGMIEKLNGYIVRRRFCYAVPVSPDVLFADMVNAFVKVTGRQPNIIIDVAGVAGLSLLIQQFDATGQTFTQAMNNLLELFPEKLIWGCDVDGSGFDRIYLLPRATSVKYKFSIGDSVKELLYPRDATQVVNRLIITGASLDGSGYPPNLAPNGSFEDTLIPGEYFSNLLQNGDFESGTGGTRPDNTWQCAGDPSVDGSRGRSGTAAVLDNESSGPEAIWEDIGVVDGLPCHATCWAMVEATNSWRFHIILTYYDASGGVLDTITGPWWTPPADNVYRHYQLDWPAPSASGAAKLRYYLEPDPTETPVTHGLNIDDCSLWIDKVSAKSWIQGASTNAYFSLLDWANADNSVQPYDGGTMVKAQAVITSGGGYAEITNTIAARVSVKQHRVYYVSAWVYVAPSSTVEVAIGGKVWQGNTLQSTLIGSVQTLTTTGWNLISYIVTTGTNSDGIDVLIRLYNGTLCYIDAVSVFENNLPDVSHQEIYYPGSDYTAVRDVTDYTSFLAAGAAASISTWGPREATVTNQNILTISDLDAYCILYFGAHATSEVNAGLTIFGPTAPVWFDGQVKIENLAVNPPALAPSNIRYEVTERDGISLTIDLDNKRPDLALLLREIQEGTR